MSFNQNLLQIVFAELRNIHYARRLSGWALPSPIKIHWLKHVQKQKSSPVLFPSIFRFISTTDSHVYPVFLQLSPCFPRICCHVGLDKSRHVTRKESQDLLQAGSLGRIMEAKSPKSTGKIYGTCRFNMGNNMV